MPPVNDTRLPAAAKQQTISAISAAQTMYASGAAGPSPAAAAAGRTKMPAPIVTLMMLAVSWRGPIARTSPASETDVMASQCTSSGAGHNACVKTLGAVLQEKLNGPCVSEGLVLRRTERPV